MHHRIGSLHLHYRVRDASLGAHVPAFDRALQGGLSEAIAARISLQLGHDAGVVVIRELAASVVLAGQDAMLDSRIVERVCRSSVDALVDTLSDPPSSDTLMRFEDEAAFVGAFIVDLLAGVAWEHWYYGAFHRHRGASIGEAIRGVLEDATDPARVLAWLSRRGKLEAILALLRASELLDVLQAGAQAPADSIEGDGTDALSQAAFALLDALGVAISTDARADLLRRFCATHAVAVDWRDRRALSGYVLRLMQFLLADGRVAASRVANASDAWRTLLDTTFDWLDGEWLAGRIEALAAPGGAFRASEAARVHSVLSPRQSRILDAIATQVREGGLRIPLHAGAEATLVRLIAAAGLQLAPGETLDASIVSALEAIARALAPASHPRGDGSGDAALTDRDLDATRAIATHNPPRDAAIDALAQISPSAASLAHVLKAAPDDAASLGDSTSTAGLYLLLRGLMDARLPALAHASAVPLAPLLGALVHRWFTPQAPFDAATSLWVGADHCDFDALETAIEGVHALNAAMTETLAFRQGIDEHTLRASLDADTRWPTPLPCSAPLDAALARTASLLMRTWAMWLRGVADSSSAFLLDNCLRRAARVGITDDTVHMDLDPAPLDVVLRMAGYFERIDRVPWLGDRRVTFAVRGPARE
ncbi:hypothetical protein LF41_3016 [Lysobacter dokdonensis DS-58]|uniref:Uncharacterized protein n=1 Tax=Lysobacter dokdonensis DS-58 TaxID=1300345 RepID=A0A0A2WGQ2_9GAMM|nr:hypothetical protein [Lysobacter dokdonensis]KGQ19366.1 hypothetical protein LF41_3016 [Lysobacter dokdonensis DS-58]